MVVLDNDCYDRVYKDLPAHHLVFRKVPICEYCGAIRFPSEGPGFCCRQGKVNIVTTRELAIANGLSPPVQHEPAVMRYHRRVHSRWP